jgi:hypothetical protein
MNRQGDVITPTENQIWDIRERGDNITSATLWEKYGPNMSLLREVTKVRRSTMVAFSTTDEQNHFYFL